MKFKDAKHKNAYLQAIQRDQVDALDLERRALLYLLTLAQDTRDHINECYNFKTGGFKQECLETPWITYGGKRAVMLGVSLFAGGSAPKINLAQVLGYPEFYPYFMEAIRLRFENI
jgi:hypothetical protein